MMIDDHDHAVFVSTFPVVVIVMFVAFVAWLLGILAIYRIPKGRLGFERLPNAPPNGFDVWSRPPVGGVKPARITRTLVMVLGLTDPQEAADWIVSMLVLVSFVGSFAATYAHGPLLAHFSEWLASPFIRISFICCVAAMGIRRWAVDNRKLLTTDVVAV